MTAESWRDLALACEEYLQIYRQWDRFEVDAVEVERAISRHFGAERPEFRDLSGVTRVELINHAHRADVQVRPPSSDPEGLVLGRLVTAYGVSVELDLQDNGRTLKVRTVDPS